MTTSRERGRRVAGMQWLATDQKSSLAQEIAAEIDVAVTEALEAAGVECDKLAAIAFPIFHAVHSHQCAKAVRALKPVVRNKITGNPVGTDTEPKIESAIPITRCETCKREWYTFPGCEVIGCEHGKKPYSTDIEE